MKKKLKKINLKKQLIKVKNTLIEFSLYNRQFIAFGILSLISCSFIRLFTIGGFFNIKAICFDIAAILLIGSLAYLFKPKKQYRYFMVMLILITIINIINSVYYAFFSSFASLSLLSTMGQAGDQGGAVLEKLKIWDFIYLLMPIIFAIYHHILKKRDYFSLVEKKENSRRLFIGVLIIGGICLFLNIATLSGSDISRFTKQWNREYIVERYGVIIYQTNDAVQTLHSKLASMFGYEEAAEEFANYYTENKREESSNKYTNMFKGYNVIVMHMESFMSFLYNLKINGVEVTPNFNKLVNEAMYFDNFYAQVSVGTSSDTEFTFNTSLMPAQSGTVFVSYYDRTYQSLEKILNEKNYYTFSMHGNKGSMWNRNKMHSSLGYRRFYSQADYNIDEVVGLGLSDHSWYQQSEAFIKEINDMVKSSKEYKNYMGTMIQLSNHTPFDDPIYQENGSEYFDVTYHTGKKDENDEEIIYDYLDGQMIGKYIQSVHYADKCLGEFLDYVRKHDEYNKTLFVFYGDHAAQLSRSQYGYFVNYDFETGELKEEGDEGYVDYDYYENEMFKRTPFVLWTKDKKITGRYSYPMGMIDALPTIGNMLGIKNPYALGHDIFEIKNNNTVVFANGNFLTNKLYYNNSKNESRIIGDTTTIDDDYIEDRKNYAEKILSISNDIIVYNLIETASDRIGEKSE